jgi:hypothetical protein
MLDNFCVLQSYESLGEPGIWPVRIQYKAKDKKKARVAFCTTLALLTKTRLTL